MNWSRLITTFTLAGVLPWLVSIPLSAEVLRLSVYVRISLMVALGLFAYLWSNFMLKLYTQYVIRETCVVLLGMRTINQDEETTTSSENVR